MNIHNPFSKSPRFYYVALFVVFLCSAAAIRLLVQSTPDSEFVLYRFIDNVQSGHGLIYGSAARAISTYPVAPLIVLVMRQALSPEIIAALFSALGGMLLSMNTDKRWYTGLAYTVVTAAQPSTVVLLMVIFALSAVLAAKQGQWLASGIWAGVAILTEPSALILTVLLLIFLLREKGAVGRYLLPAVLIPVLGFALLRIGLNVPFTLISIAPGMVSFALPLLGLVILLLVLLRRYPQLVEQPTESVLIVWSLSLALLALFTHAPLNAAVLPGILAAVSLIPVSLPVLAVLLISTALDILPVLVTPSILPASLQPEPRIMRSVGNQLSVEQQAGEWIKAHTSPQDRVATSEIGALPYYAQRSILSFDNVLNRAAPDAHFFLDTMPEAVVLRKDQVVAWEPFKTTYAQTFAVGDLLIYQRAIGVAVPTSHAVNIPFDANLSRHDLQLLNVSVAESAHPGDLIPVRLDWQLAYVQSFDVTISLDLLDTNGKSVLSLHETFPPTYWRTGIVSTYHYLVLPRKMSEENLNLLAKVNIRNGELGQHEIGNITVRTLSK